MNITTDLEQSKRLKELGAEQNSEFVWGWTDSPDGGPYYERMELFYWPDYPFKEEALSGDAEYCAAYTLSELIDWLDEQKDFELHRSNEDGWIIVSRTYDEMQSHILTGKTPIDALVALAEAVKGKGAHG